MRQAEVYMNSILAGILTEKSDNSFHFCYDDRYFLDMSKPAISLTLPKTKQEYSSETLFPFFYNMLSEGANRRYQASLFHADEEDYFKILVESASHDNIGAITFKWKL